MRSHASVALLLALCGAVVEGAAAAFCADGIPLPELAPSDRVRLWFLEAPLLSTAYGPLPGEALHAYHVALAFEVTTAEKRYNLTLEFDNTAGMLSLPRISGRTLTWTPNPAKYCLTQGLLYGEGHWKKAVMPLIRFSGSVFNSLASGFFLHYNNTFEYQPFRVVGPNMSEPALIEDTTCGTGAVLLVRHLERITQQPSQVLRTSRLTLHVQSVSEANVTHSATMDAILAFYQEANAIVGKNTSVITRVKDAYKLTKGRKFLHQGGIYASLNGATKPYARIYYLPDNTTEHTRPGR